MHELVHSILYSKLLSALRLPSFAGDGLPERMRSVSFALLGLTAAAGLALVAIFAQPNFPLLSPAPLPAEPSLSESVGDAKKATLDHPTAALITARPARAKEEGGGSPVNPASEGPSRSSGGFASSPTPSGAEAPAPVSAPGPSGGNNGGGGAGNETGGGSSPAPTAAPGQVAPPPAPTPSPQPPVPQPEATTSTPKPEPAPAPGNSSSAAAAAHAGERGIEASSGSGSPAGASTAVVSSAPEVAPASDNGNGLAKGHDK